MKLSRIFNGICLLASLLIFNHCDSDKPVAKFSYKVDGNSKSVKSKTAFLEITTDYDHEGRALYITAANGLTQFLSVAVANWDFTNPPANGINTGTYDATFDYELNEDNPSATCLDLTGANAGVTLCEGALITYFADSKLYFSAFDGNTGGTVTISACNAAEKIISGSFSAKVQTFDAEEVTITGTFSNIPYIIQ